MVMLIIVFGVMLSLMESASKWLVFGFFRDHVLKWTDLLKVVF